MIAGTADGGGLQSPVRAGAAPPKAPAPGRQGLRPSACPVPAAGRDHDERRLLRGRVGPGARIALIDLGAPAGRRCAGTLTFDASIWSETRFTCSDGSSSGPSRRTRSSALDHGDGEQGPVQLPVSASVETMPSGLPARRRQRGCAGVRGEGSRGGESLDATGLAEPSVSDQ